MLDVARKTLIELLDTISGSLQAIKIFKTLKSFYLTQDYTNYLSKTSNVPIKIAYTYKRDFYFKIKLKSVKNKPIISLPNDSKMNNEVLASLFNNKTPEEFIKVRVLKQSIQFTTKSLLNLNERINETKEDIYEMSNK